MSEIRKLGKESVIYGISTVLTRLINFFLVPLYTHYLLPDDYGRVSAVFSLIAFLNVFYVLGLNQGYMRFKSKENLSKTMSFVFIFGFFLSVFVILFSGFFARIIGVEESYSNLISYAVLIVWLDAISTIPLADLRMEHKAYAFVAVRSLSIVLNVILNVVFLKYLKKGIDGVFYAAIISSLSQVIFLKDYLRFFSLRLSFSSMKDIFSYSLPYVPSYLSSVTVQLIDRPIMMHFLSPYYVGLYQANFRLGVFMNLFVSMFDFAWRPFVIERINRSDARAIFKKVFVYFSFFLIYLFFVLSLFIKDIVRIPIGKTYLINPNYWSCVDIVPIVMAGYIFSGFYINFMVGSIITKKTVYSMYANLASSFSAIILNFILIPRFGVYGAAVSFLIANIVLAGYMYFANRKLYPVDYPIFRVMMLFLLTVFLYLVVERMGFGVFSKLLLSIFYPFVVILPLSNLRGYLRLFLDVHFFKGFNTDKGQK